MDMAETNRHRATALEALTQELERMNPSGLTWKRMDRHYGYPLVWGMAEGKQERAVIQAVWPDPEWHSPGHSRYKTRPSAAEAHYEMTATRLQDYGTGHPEQTAHLISPHITEVIEALEQWRDQEPPTLDSRIGRPIDETDLDRLRLLASIRQNAPEAGIVQIEDDLRQQLTEDACRSLTTGRIFQNYPRDADGRLPLHETILLAPYGQEAPSESKRSLWMVAVSPEKRRAPQAITLGLRWVIATNHAHRWDSAPWLWDALTPFPIQIERWDVADLPLFCLGTASRDEHIRERQGTLNTQVDRVALCLLLQDAGRFGEAFALFGVEADEDIWRLLDGRVPHDRYEGLGETWAGVLTQTFRHCAPWRLHDALKKAPGKPRAHRLLALPHQTQTRKLSLMLLLEGDTPRFILDGTASNARLPEVLWQRPIEIDLLRFGLLDVAQNTQGFSPGKIGVET